MDVLSDNSFRWRNWVGKGSDGGITAYAARTDTVGVPADIAVRLARWESALYEKLRGKGYDCMETHCLRDEVKAKYNQPYFPGKENDQQSARNAIRVRAGVAGKPVEISTILDRLRPVAERPALAQVRYYVPCDSRVEIQDLKNGWVPQL
jgi:hypothetical protein